MGKKGPKAKGKQVIMSQAEFFANETSQASSGQPKLESEWGKGDIFGDKQNGKPVVVKATGKPIEDIFKQPDLKSQSEEVKKSEIESQPKEKESKAERVEEEKKPKEVVQETLQQANTAVKEKQDGEKPKKSQPQQFSAQPQLRVQGAQPQAAAKTSTALPIKPPAQPVPQTFIPTRPPPQMPMPIPMPMPGQNYSGFQGFHPSISGAFYSYNPAATQGFYPPSMQQPGIQQPGFVHPSMRIISDQAQHGQQQVSTSTTAKTSKPQKIEKKPDNYEDAMKLFEQKSKIEEVSMKKKQRKPEGQVINHSIGFNQEPEPIYDEYGNEIYYDEEYGLEDDYQNQIDPSMIQQIFQDPSQLQQVLSGMANNPFVQSSLNPNQLGMLMDPNQVSMLSHMIAGYSNDQPGMQNLINAGIPMPQMAQMQQIPMTQSGMIVPNVAIEGMNYGQQIPTLNSNDYHDPEVDNIDDLIQGHDPFGDQYYQEEQLNPKPIAGSASMNPKLFGGMISKQELEDCQDDDDIIDLFLSNPDRFTPCQYFLRGNCRYGDNCRYLHPEDSQQEEGQEKKLGRYSLDEECSICLEKVLASGRQFGILDACDHTFCLKCIRGWRSTYDKRTSKHHYRTCPTCRRNSYLVIPSDHIVKSGPEKDELIQEYKAALKTIPCKHFNRGKGECPFMNSCNYAHLLSNGQPYEYPWKENKINENGEWEDDIEPTLAERFGNLNF